MSQWVSTTSKPTNKRSTLHEQKLNAQLSKLDNLINQQDELLRKLDQPSSSSGAGDSNEIKQTNCRFESFRSSQTSSSEMHVERSQHLLNRVERKIRARRDQNGGTHNSNVIVLTNGNRNKAANNHSSFDLHYPASSRSSAAQSCPVQFPPGSRPLIIGDRWDQKPIEVRDLSTQLDPELPSKEALLTPAIDSRDLKRTSHPPNDDLHLKFSGRTKDWRMFAASLGNWFKNRPHIDLAARLGILNQALDVKSQSLIEMCGDGSKEAYMRAVYLLCAAYDNEKQALADLAYEANRLPQIESMHDYESIESLLNSLRSLQCSLESWKASASFIQSEVLSVLPKLFPEDMKILLLTRRPQRLSDFIRMLEETRNAVLDSDPTPSSGSKKQVQPSSSTSASVSLQKHRSGPTATLETSSYDAETKMLDYGHPDRSNDRPMSGFASIDSYPIMDRKPVLSYHDDDDRQRSIDDNLDDYETRSTKHGSISNSNRITPVVIDHALQFGSEYPIESDRDDIWNRLDRPTSMQDYRDEDDRLTSLRGEEEVNGDRLPIASRSTGYSISYRDQAEQSRSWISSTTSAKGFYDELADERNAFRYHELYDEARQRERFRLLEEQERRLNVDTLALERRWNSSLADELRASPRACNRIDSNDIRYELVRKQENLLEPLEMSHYRSRSRSINSHRSHEDHREMTVEDRKRPRRSRTPIRSRIQMVRPENNELLGRKKSGKSSSTAKSRKSSPPSKCCQFCYSWSHKSGDCINYITVESRLKRARDLRLCIRCLSLNHRISKCPKVFRCANCHSNHFNFMCEKLDDPESASLIANAKAARIEAKAGSSAGFTSGDSRSTRAGLLSSLPLSVHHVLYAKTVHLRVCGSRSSKVVAALIDEGSSHSFVSRSLCDQIGLEVNSDLHSPGPAVTPTLSRAIVKADLGRQVTIRLSSLTSAESMQLNCYLASGIVPPKSTQLPADWSSMVLHSDPQVADNLRETASKSVDILLGGRLVKDLWNHRTLQLQHNLTAVRTPFGWAIRNVS